LAWNSSTILNRSRDSGCQAGSSSMGVAACLFFQCIMEWRSLPQARGQGAEVSTLPCGLPQPNMSSASQKGP
jgi:hypothetical protein